MEFIIYDRDLLARRDLADPRGHKRAKMLLEAAVAAEAKREAMISGSSLVFTYRDEARRAQIIVVCADDVIAFADPRRRFPSVTLSDILPMPTEYVDIRDDDTVLDCWAEVDTELEE